MGLLSWTVTVVYEDGHSFTIHQVLGSQKAAFHVGWSQYNIAQTLLKEDSAKPILVVTSPSFPNDNYPTKIQFREDVSFEVQE